MAVVAPAAFFAAVSFTRWGQPNYDGIRPLFLERGLLIRSSGAAPQVSDVEQFIAPRAASAASGELSEFREWELSGESVVWGNVGHRLSRYAKTGMSAGTPIEGRGLITTQFVRTPEGWRISVMAWDDERPGLSLDQLDSATP